MKHIIIIITVAFVFSFIHADQDADDMSTSYEEFFGLSDSNASDAVINSDSDTLTNNQEALLWTDPFIADTDTDGFQDGEDSNALSRAVMYWGAAQFTDGGNYSYTGPNWWLGGYKSGGTWVSNGWHSATGQADSLNIDLDRSELNDDPVLDLELTDSASTELIIGLYNTNDTLVATNLYGNILTGSEEDVLMRLMIPLSNYPTAVGIRLTKTTGSITMYRSTLYVDRDGDGLDADQENLQVGTSDTDSDSDDDELNDYTEVFITYTDALNADTDTDGVNDGHEVQRETDPNDAGDVNRTIYVDISGNNSNDGYRATAIDGHGPKQNVHAGIETAISGDIVEVAAGTYSEQPWTITDKNLIIKPKGDVTIK